MNTTAQTLRKTIRAKRRALSPLQQRLASRRLFQKLKKHPRFLSAKHIAFYHAIDGELSVEPIIQEAWRLGKACYLPSVQKNSQQLKFFRFTKKSKLSKKKMGVSESQKGKTLPIKRLDLVLMPIVAFDKQGNRLGMGGGYYDFSFRHLQKRKLRKTYLLATAHRCQEAGNLSTQSWDIKPDKIFAV